MGDDQDNVVRMRQHPSAVHVPPPEMTQERLERLKLRQQQVLTFALIVISIGTMAFVLGLVAIVWRFALTF